MFPEVIPKYFWLKIVNEFSDSNRTMDSKQSKKMQRVQNLLKRGRANLNRSRSELGDHNRKILQQLTRHRSDFGEQNKKIGRAHV